MFDLKKENIQYVEVHGCTIKFKLKDKLLKELIVKYDELMLSVLLNELIENYNLSLVRDGLVKQYIVK